MTGLSSIDARVTVRFRVVQTEGIAAHRIIPMRWPDDEGAWPAAGEEDYCEGDDLDRCATVLQYGPSNSQDSAEHAIDLTQWHTITVERRAFTVTVWIDDALVWTYAGSEATMPSTLKHVVLRPECRTSCPVGTDGHEEILVDYVAGRDAPLTCPTARREWPPDGDEGPRDPRPKRRWAVLGSNQ